MTLYLAPRQTIDIYADEKIYAFQKIDGRMIGVDTARYYFSIDGRDDEIKTGADGWWGSFEEYYRENGKGPHLRRGCPDGGNTGRSGF